MGKTQNLFRRRFLDLLARAALEGDEYIQWREDAVAIQGAIYSVDFYYEENATLLAQGEAPLWRFVEKAVARSSGGSSCLAWSRLMDLRRYATVEARIHAFDAIDGKEFGEIVGWKCADVGIARELIWGYGREPRQVVQDFWRRLDECAELIEDLTDIPEDCRDWNFNFWLYSFRAKGNSEESITSTSRVLGQRLDWLENSYRCMAPSERARYRRAFSYTVCAGRRALDRAGIVFDVVASGAVARYGGHEVEGAAARYVCA
jgi:hypothetical protein